MALLRSIAVLTLLVPLAVCAPKPGELLAKEAARAEKAGDSVRAYLLYSQAAAADRTNREYWARATALRGAAEAASSSRLATPELEESPEPLKPGPGSVIGTFTTEDLEAMQRLSEPIRLKPSSVVKSFKLRSDAKSLFEHVAGEFGYKVIFDRDYTASTQIRFELSDAGYRLALHALEDATNSFIVPITDTVMLVAQDTQQKRTELETDEAVGIPIPQRTSIQEAQEILSMVQQGFEVRRAILDQQRRMILLRDRVSKVEAARAVLEQMATGRPQVSVDVEFLSTGASSSLSLGMTLPNKFPLVYFGGALNSMPSVPAGFLRFLTFGAGKTLFGIGLTDATLFATASRSSARSLMRSTLTASDGQPVTFHVGDKYPIVTGGYLGYGNLPGSGFGGGGSGGGTTLGVVSTASYADIFSSAVTSTGQMKLTVNGIDYPIVVPLTSNNLAGLQTIINSLQAGVYASAIQRGTTAKPLSLALIANNLAVTSIALVDDPNGAAVQLTKAPNVASAISADYVDATSAKVSTTGTLQLTVDSDTFDITLTPDKNDLTGLRDAINAATDKVKAGVLLSSPVSSSYFLQVVAKDSSIGTIQLNDDPTGANTPLLTSTTQVNQVSQVGQTVAGTTTTPSTGGLGSLGQVYTPPPTFNFEDLGLVLKLTPFIHDANELTLEVEAEFKVLGNGSFNGIPVISTRKFQGKVRLRSSEWAVVAGLVTDSQTRNITGIPGLMDLPGLGLALRDNQRSHDETNILIVLKPHITSLPASEFPGRTIWIGSETRLLTPL